ncbi:hypothetical protein V8E36_009226 [Tilletia maclaganii]
MSAQAGPSRVRMEDDEELSLAMGRPKRSTAGNRMRALLKTGLEPEELFEEVPDDFEYEAAQADPDIIDSDFDKSSEEEIPEDVAEKEIEALEKAQKKAERQRKLPTALRLAQAHRSNIGLSQPGTSAESKPRRKRKTPEEAKVPQESDDDDDDSNGPTRLIMRKSTLARTQEVAEKIRAKQERAANRVKRDRTARPKLTQDALIAQALEMEDYNRESLRAYLEQEEDRKARARAPKRTVIEGPFLRWRSIAIKDAGSRGAASLVQLVDEDEPSSTPGVTDAHVTEDPVLAARAEATRAKAAATASSSNHRETSNLARDTPQQTYSRNLISLHDVDEDADWAERQAALFGHQSEWDIHEVVRTHNRPARPRQSVCPITGLPALYQDPRTGVPFATAEAQHTLTDLLDNEFVWTGGLGEAMVNVGCWLSREGEDGAGGIIAAARRIAEESAS